MAEELSWDDINTLSVLTSEKGDDRNLPMIERERWIDIAVRIHSSKARPRDLHAAAELAEVDAALQRDAKVRQRYLDLAARAMAAARSR